MEALGPIYANVSLHDSLSKIAHSVLGRIHFQLLPFDALLPKATTANSNVIKLFILITNSLPHSTQLVKVVLHR